MEYVFSFVDLWPYILIALLFILCYYYKIQESSKIIYFTLLLFSCLRYDVGWDYDMYVWEIGKGYDLLIEGRFEPLSKVIFIIASELNFYPIAFIFFAWLTLRLVSLSIDKYSVNPTISWLVFYSFPLFFFASLSTIRQSLATALILYSYQFAVERKIVKFLLIIMVAFLFHTSAISGLIILPLLYLNVSKKGNYILFISSFFLSIIIKKIILSSFINELSVISRLQEFYIDADTASPTKLQYLYYIIAVVNLIYYDKLVALNSLNKQIISITTFGIFFFNVFSFEPISASRISAFFLLFWIYLIPYYSKIFSIRYGKIIQHIIFTLLLSLSFYYLSMYVSSYQNNIQEKVSFLPYKFWFFNL
ncbi:EpsG family protein [Flavobacterium soyangense]|uniref:EpsG family protein n=1 Tax=Flavobacterium soyangense TaxID=2023265 RepID=A0A930U796_9FLAO|nr:EpsG family protein [Flavobacterium soyangense]MBF2708208.1 EpsG family protein [Flavobacterium soyangense]